MPHAKPRLYRDPVHDTIVWDPESAMGRLLIDLVDTREMQRLRRVRQLAMSCFVYHGAEHSRFAHSVGVAWLATRMLDQIGRTVALTEEQRLLTVAAAILHDIGHAPFSHALEDLAGGHHESRGVELVLDPDSDVHQVLANVDPTFPERVASWMRGSEDSPAYLREVVASQLDADRLDYILRDGHMTGVRIGDYDLARILAMLDVVDGHLALHRGAQAAVEGYLLARFHMYQQVYLHKTSRAAERVLVGALRRAAALKRDGHALAHWPGGPLGDMLLGRPVAPGAFITVDEVDVWSCLKAWVHEEDGPLADLSEALVHRRLWKPWRLPSVDDRRGDEIIAAARSIARVKGFDPEMHVLVDDARDSPYRPYTGVGGGAESIRIIDEAGRGGFIEDSSEVVQMLGRMRHRQRLLCVHPGLRGATARLFNS